MRNSDLRERARDLGCGRGAGDREALHSPHKTLSDHAPEGYEGEGQGSKHRESKSRVSSLDMVLPYLDSSGVRARGVSEQILQGLWGVGVGGVAKQTLSVVQLGPCRRPVLQTYLCSLHWPQGVAGSAQVLMSSGWAVYVSAPFSSGSGFSPGSDSCQAAELI